ncbi:MAG: sensor domain-containing diguanylate cyclase [Clostridium sp.]|nr:sensor domain-containing diguanylate cyclase [Clostridium sp.]
MNKNSDNEEKLTKITDEYAVYQSFAENTIQILNEKNIRLEKQLDALTNIVQISQYINSNISDRNLIPMINDMIIGILGAAYSSIYLTDESGILTIKATNKNELLNLEQSKINLLIKERETFEINSKNPLFHNELKKSLVHSIIGVPINLGSVFKGYIIVEHTLYNFFNKEHISFISSITNQIGIALENNVLYNKIKETSITDPLLKIYNRRYFFEHIDKVIKSEPNRNFYIVMVDIDNFKNVNDTYGHQFGDVALIETTNLIKKSVGSENTIARYGGEEIVIYIVGTYENKVVYNMIENIRKNLVNNSIKYEKNEAKISASFGISKYPQDGNSFEKVLNVADSMLYKAKKQGRNKVISSF